MLFVIYRTFLIRCGILLFIFGIRNLLFIFAIRCLKSLFVIHIRYSTFFFNNTFLCCNE